MNIKVSNIKDLMIIQYDNITKVIAETNPKDPGKYPPVLEITSISFLPIDRRPNRKTYSQLKESINWVKVINRQGEKYLRLGNKYEIIGALRNDEEHNNILNGIIKPLAELVMYVKTNKT